MAAESRIFAPDGSTVANVLTYDYRFNLIDTRDLKMIDEIEAYCWDCSQFVASEQILTPEDIATELDWISTLSGKNREGGIHLRNDRSYRRKIEQPTRVVSQPGFTTSSAITQPPAKRLSLANQRNPVSSITMLPIGAAQMPVRLQMLWPTPPITKSTL